MTVTAASFVVRFPEFRGTGTAEWATYLGLFIAAAIDETPSSIWGTRIDEGVLYLAAHKLSCSPWGMNAKLMAKDGSTTYGRERKRLESIVVAGRGRVGVDEATGLALIGAWPWQV